MPAKGQALADARSARRDHATRLRRFAKHLERWCRGEPIHSYDTKWLAYLKEHQLERRQRPWKT